MAKTKINRKVIVSFLNGSLCLGSYTPSNNPTQTITCSSEQEALAELLAKDWSSDDAFILLASPEADIEAAEASIRSSFAGQLQTVVVPTPNSNANLYQILDAFVAAIEEKDQLFFHANSHFGLLPAFTNTFVHYAKISKNIRIGGIYTMLHNDDDIAVIELSSNQQLENWTSAVDVFLKDGSSTPLQILIQKLNPALAAQLSAFNAAMTTVRGMEICYEFDYTSLKASLLSLEAPEIGSQVKALLARTVQKFDGFSNNSTANGLAAAQWCLQHNLIQQGYTFLQETLKSHLIDQVFKTDGESMRTVFTVRELANEALKGKKHTEMKAQIAASKARNIPHIALQKIQQICQWAKDSDLMPLYTLIGGQGGLRNDMRHGGISLNPNAAVRLKGKLESFIARIRQTIENA